VLVRTLRQREGKHKGAIGVDPGETAGAVVHVRVDPFGAPVLMRIRGWTKLKRKTGHVWRVREWFGPGIWRAREWEMPSLALVLSGFDALGVSVIGVEDVAQHGAKKGTLALAEAAGVARGVLGVSFPGVAVLRPHRNEWCPAVVGAGTAASDAAVIAAMYGRPLVGRRTVATWGLEGLPADLEVSHIADATGIALWSLGYRLGDAVEVSP